jgi:hypothetical protein
MTPRKRDLRVAVEVGPKDKKVVAIAPDWPGLERGAKSEAEAVERLLDYLPRYANVAKLAKRESEFANLNGAKVMERYAGTGSTDFWGISFAFSTFDQRAMSSDELERELSLMRACWTYFDQVRARVSAEMQKGPRGGGRDRDRIVRHTFAAEQDWAKKLGVRTTDDDVITDAKELKKFRSAYCTAVQRHHAERATARTWPLRYLIRHTAFHTMDHAWEMEDKDMSG